AAASAPSECCKKPRRDRFPLPTFPPPSMNRISTKNALSKEPQIVLPFRRVVRVAVHTPGLRHVLFLQVGIHAWTDADQADLLAVGDPEQLQPLLGLRWIGHEFRRWLCIGRGGKSTHPGEGIQVRQAKVERLAAAHAKPSHRTVFMIRDR